MIHRIFAEKRKGFDVAAQKLNREIKNVLGINSKARIFIRYDVDCAKEDFLAALNVVFSEPPADRVYRKLPKTDGKALIIEYLPGQFDQRADSAAQCMQMLTLKEKPQVKCATAYIFEGISDGEFEKIKKFLINPVECREAFVAKPRSLNENYPKPAPEKQVEGFINQSPQELENFHRENSFAFSLDDLKFIQDFFKKEKRNPFNAELKVLDTYWSDHCRHTTFNTELESVEIDSDIPEIGQAYKKYNELFQKHYSQGKYKSLMSMATIGAKELESQGLLPHLDKSKEINACSIKIKADADGQKQDWTVMFKNETHNHPTEIEPFGGAATCLGGAIRDPLSGRVYVYQSMRVSGAADINQSLKDTIKGKLPQRVISTSAASGFSSYGNQIGLATGQVTEIYHLGYAAKRMEAGFVVGAAPSQNIIREEPAAGDKVLLIGGATGRDGCGGATGSSKAHNSESVNLCGAEVQKGNAPIERKLQRLFRNPEFSRLVKRSNDFGAGGVAVAVGELADGVEIDLDEVPKKYQGLSGTELAISESQERMAVVIDTKNVDKIKELCAEENLNATVIAKITRQPRLRMFFKGQKFIDLPREFLDTNGVRQKASAKILDKKTDYLSSLSYDENKLFESGDYASLAKKILQKPNVASQKGQTEMFDSTIGAGTVLMPLGGSKQLSPSIAMAAKLPVLWQTDTATVAAYGLNPDLMALSPFVGAAYSVALSVIKAAVSGADYDTIYLSFQEFFEKLGKNLQRWGKPTAALLGALTAQLGLKKAAIGGKDSMSGSFENIDVPPTLISFALGIANANSVIGGAARTPGCRIYRFKLKREPSGLPDFDSLSRFLKAFNTLTAAKKIEFATVTEEGGAVAAIIKSLLGEGLGFKFNGVKKDMFTPSLGDVIFGVSKGETSAQGVIDGFGCELLGETINSEYVIFGGVGAEISVLEASYKNIFENIYPTSAPATGTASKKDFKGGSLVFCTNKIAAPRVFIPVFPGTNCEYDTARAFEKAGAKTDVFVIKNLTAEDMAQSIKEIQNRIKESNILAIPGGFSGGDEPDGSGKFIAAALSNPHIADEIHTLLYTRDGLVLGICNGFQALIKLGLLPYGKIAPLKKDSPTLTFNRIGRHVSQIVNVRVASNLSPWLSLVKVGSVFTQPVSHGEGRFVASNAQLKQMHSNGQIATQYAGFKNKPVMQTPFNPNGSIGAVEGITSPDGRVFGKMGHAERIGDGLYKNINGEWDMRIFESGVKYFK